jgi:hypothetical protein
MDDDWDTGSASGSRRRRHTDRKTFPTRLPDCLSLDDDGHARRARKPRKLWTR